MALQHQGRDLGLPGGEPVGRGDQRDVLPRARRFDGDRDPGGALAVQTPGVQPDPAPGPGVRP
nr:hypothetical protein [Streptomyces tsukubensis NRRL18488]